MKFQKQHLKASIGIFALSLMTTSISQATVAMSIGGIKKPATEGKALVKDSVDKVSNTQSVRDKLKLEEPLRYIVTFKKPKSMLSESFNSVSTPTKTKGDKGSSDVFMVKNGEVNKDVVTTMLKSIGATPKKFIRGTRSAAVKMNRSALGCC